MAYLLPAGSAPRTKNKWRLGAVPMRNGTSQMIVRPPISTGGVPPMPGPIPVAPNPAPSPIRTYPMPGPIPVAPIIRLGPFTNLPAPVTTPTTSGTPVPAGFPTNQFYVAPDGSVWEYSTSSNSWFNTGTPYRQPGSTPTASSSPVPAGYPTTSAYTDSVGNIWTWNGTAWVVSGSVNSGGLLTPSSPSTPVSVTVSPTSTDTGYQAVLDWLTQQTLIGSLPNWLVLAGGALAYKTFFASGKGR